MKTKHFIICWLPIFIVVFALNGLFHSVLAASFFDDNLHQLRPAITVMKEGNPLPVAILDLILTFGMVFFITQRQTTQIKPSEAIIAGSLVNFISSSAWNLANTSLFNWPVIVTLGDVVWHTCLGGAGGFMIMAIYNKILKRSLIGQ